MIVERGVNEHADLVADALDNGRTLDMSEVVALAQEIVRLQREHDHFQREIDFLVHGEER